MRLIDADALTRCIEQKFDAHYGNTCYQVIHDFFRCVHRLIRKAPTIEARPVVRGEWINDGLGDWYCSSCRVLHTFDEYGDVHPLVDCGYNFCPNCGADMRGDGDGK